MLRSISALTLTALLSAACAVRGPGPTTATATPEATTVERTEVDDEGFAAAALTVLQHDEASPRRLGLLVEVVTRQLDRADNHFRGGHEDMGLAALRGAMYLVRSGELRPEMLAGRSAVLQRAASAFARLGLEGQAFALYSLLVERLPAGAERKEASDHLDALQRWQRDTRRPGSMQARGAAQQASMQQSLLDPSPSALHRAHAQSLLWIERAMTFGGDRTPPRSHFEQDETMEAFRAIRTAPLTFVALYLRHGDAEGALASLEDDNVARVTAPRLLERLESAAADNDPEAWAELFRLFESAASGESEGVGIDPELARAAAWGAAIELYRAEPQSFRAAVPICSLLLSHGMGEVAPLILEQALGGEEHPREASWATRYVLEAIHQAEELGDLPAARRTFRHSSTLLRLSQRAVYDGRVTPSASRLHYFMGAIEAGAGQLERAHYHLSLAVDQEPTADALRMLSSIDRQRKAFDPALESLDRVLEITHRSGDASAEAESHLLRFEVLREMNDPLRAEESLESALMLGLSARTTAQSKAGLARAERVLARALEHYDEPEAARRASTRAYEASRNDMRQLTQTVLDSSRRALTLGDLRTARDSVRRAVAADLAVGDTVYAALWLQLLERRLEVASDGTVEEALALADDASGWVAKLAAWGRGRLSGQQLADGADSRIQKVEALFYQAMSAPSGTQARRRLEEVARSEAIQLVEVTIARDLLAAWEKQPKPKLPAHVELP